VARETTAAGPGIVLFPDARLPPAVERLGPEFGRGGAHGGGYETSLVLAAAPHLVRDDVRLGLAPNFVDIAERIRGGARTAAEAGGTRAYFGDPAAASAAEGERLFGVLAAVVADAVAEALGRRG
jgi:creatinine amidohydrolase